LLIILIILLNSFKVLPTIVLKSMDLAGCNLSAGLLRLACRADLLPGGALLPRLVPAAVRFGLTLLALLHRLELVLQLLLLLVLQRLFHLWRYNGVIL
jgi:hypothetical protein